VSAMLILGHACCHDGEWTGVDETDTGGVVRIVLGMVGEFIWFWGCCFGESMSRLDCMKPSMGLS
jgi:hypothetical protein